MAAELQHLFARLALSLRAAVDPSALLRALLPPKRRPSFGFGGGFAPGAEADVSEFGKLLLERLEKPCPRVRELIYGELAETVVADEGGGGAPLRQSSRCPFSELLLPVAAAGGDLDGAIREALRPSALEGFVGPSGRRAGSAHKEVALLSLPQLLCLQLQRVTYDAEAGRARKLDASVAFPLRLDMGPYVSSGGGNGGGWRYVLRAVLLHEGAASSGHYQCVCRAGGGSGWVRLSDDDCEVADDDLVRRLCARGGRRRAVLFVLCTRRWRRRGGGGAGGGDD